MRTLRICMAQINTTVGDLDGNTRKIIRYIDEARTLGADLVAFPELAVTGYPPEDLLLMPRFLERNLQCLDTIRKETTGLCAVVGFVDKDGDLYNAAAVLHDGRLAGVYHKIFLPNYGVFDEHRYFQAGHDIPVYRIGETVVGINICEDIWYPGDPTHAQALTGEAELILNISASPYHAEKGNSRKRMLSTRATDNVACVAFTNLVGGQDELIFDGASMLFDQQGRLVCRGRQFQEDLVVADLDMDAVFRQRIHDPRRRKEKRAAVSVSSVTSVDIRTRSRENRPPLAAGVTEPLGRLQEITEALTLGVHDYVRKNGFEKVLIGLSGGIDSSLVAALAVRALGGENVEGVSMPSSFTSGESIEDAEALAANLGMGLRTVPIDPAFTAYERMLAPHFEGTSPGVTEENIQARIRGTILMALSNKYGWLVFTTGNKSETSVGYCTLYGDMAGGFAVIKDVPKTLVYELCEWINADARRELIPSRVLTKAPSAELRPNQKDSDSLPPYPVLDPILRAYVEEDMSLDEIVHMGFDRSTVGEIMRLVDINEYKRRQSPPGIKITPRALGKDRRLPISNMFRHYC